MKQHVVALMLALFVSGCAEKNIPDYSESVHNKDLLASIKLSKETSELKPIEAQLTQAAVLASNALSDLAEVKRARSEVFNPVFPEELLQSDFAQMVSIDWSGPIEPVMKMLVQVSGYELKVFGSSPTIVPIVTVNAQNVPVGDVIKDVVYQAQDQVEVKVTSSGPGKQVELYYKGI